MPSVAWRLLSAAGKQNKNIFVMRKTLLAYIIISAALCACGGKNKANDTVGASAAEPCGPVFNADSAYSYCAAQCDFGPRVMNSEAHERCGEWIAGRFEAYGMTVTRQKAVLRGYDGTPLKSTNIIASHKPERKERVMICAHWDTRPWADNDPDSANYRKPVLGANDGASGVAVMLEVARLLSSADSLSVGVDFVCFDAEDWGVPSWSDVRDDGNSFALGAQYWAANPHVKGYKPRFGVLLDMVGGQGARFYREAFSMQYAPGVVEKVWDAAELLGFGSYFPVENGGMISDDHVPVNQIAGIPTIDIVPYYPECEASSFGPTWHTVHDDMSHIDRNTLQAVGQTVIQVLFSEGE